MSQNQYDARLLSRFTAEELTAAQANDQQFIQRHLFELDYGYEILDILPEKAQSLEPLKYFNGHTEEVLNEVESLDDVSFNLFEYCYERDLEGSRYYKIGNTGKVLHVFSSNQLVKLYNSEYHEQ